jgi:hypothetical protein
VNNLEAVDGEKTSRSQSCCDSYHNHNVEDVEKMLESYMKLLVLEIGSEEMVQEAMHNPGGWRGRAERIAELEQQLQKIATTKRDSPTLIVDKRKTTELELLVKQMQESLKQMETEKLSLKSRIRSLESALKDVREENQVLVQREKVNGQITEALKRFILQR